MSRKASENQPGLFADEPMPAHVDRSSPSPASKPPVEREPRVQCRAVDCIAAIHPVKLMCAQHWHQVPPGIQKRVYQHYRPGQSIETATTPYLLAAADAVEAIARLERRDPTNVFRRMAETRGPT